MQLSGKRVLLTGDSHMESAFGSRLAASLEAQGAIVVRLPVGGSSARAWASGQACRPGTTSCRTVEELIAAGPYDLVIVSLGTNDAANTNRAGTDPIEAAQRTVRNIRTFVGRLDAPTTYIVGPPTMADRGYYTNAAMAPVIAAEREAFGSQFIDSTSVPRLDGDGIHMGPRSGARWAELVMNQLEGAADSGSSLARLLLALTPFGPFLNRGVM